jgi:hypothetical protein
MNINLDGSTITAALQVINTVVLIPVIKYVIRIEHRLTALETKNECEKKAS